MRLFLILLSLTVLLFSSFARAAEHAIVSSDKGIVYAEDTLITPIGYLRRGKKIIVGSNPLKQGLIYSVVLTGRIAYIQAKDIHISKEGDENKKVTEHNVAIIEGVEEELYSINNHSTLIMASMNMGDEWTNIMQTMGDESSESSLPYWRLLFEHRDPRFKANWSLGMDFMGKEQGPVKLSAWGFEGNANYSPLRTNFFTTDFFFGILGFPTLKITNSLALDQEQMGKMWGYQYGVQARLFPYSQWGAVAGLMYTSLAVSINPIITQQESTDPADPVYSQELTKIAGWCLFLGASYKF